MKRRFSILKVFVLSMGLSLFMVACSSDDDSNNLKSGETQVTFADLPTTMRTFVSDHFDTNTVNNVVKKGQGYDVNLANYKIEFDSMGNWVEIDAYNDGALPATVLALIPRQIVSYVAEFYPQRSISEISVETYGYDVDLTGNPDIDLKFDATGNILSVDGNQSSNEVKVDVSALPEVSQTFLATHFSDMQILKIEKDDDSYDVDFANKIEVDFDLTGAWKKVDADNNTLPQSVINLLPQSAVNYINTNYGQRRVEKIECKVSFYEVEIHDDMKLIFDLSGNIWSDEGIKNPGNDHGNNNTANNDRVDYSALPENAKSFITTHFSDATVRYVENDDDEYEVKLSDGSEIDFDLSGNVKSIEVIKTTGIPASAMPAQIANYVKANYPSKVIMEYSKKSKGYEVELSGYPEIDLLFDLSGNFLGLD